MKWSYAVLSLVMGLTVNAEASDLNGTWTLDSRKCSSGATARDGFDSKTGLMLISIVDDKAVSLVDMGRGKDRYVVSSTITHAGAFVIFQPATIVLSSVQDLTIAASGPGVLEVSRDSKRLSSKASGFGPGGTCPVGDTLTMMYKRK